VEDLLKVLGYATFFLNPKIKAMQKVQQIIGADLSKRTIDLCVHLSKSHLKIENSISGFKEMLRWMKQQRIDFSEVMIVMEHTGLYSYCFEGFLHESGIRFTKINSVQIKWSIGVVRGKNDKIDASRIARYGYEKKDHLAASSDTQTNVKRLAMLRSIRALLVKQKAALLCSIQEYRCIGISKSDLILKSQLEAVKVFEKEVEKIDAEITRIIDASQSLKTNYYLVQSIKGVGKVVALATLIKTGNFTRFKDARKFACFCGTAPFEHTSGTSIKGRTRVSHLADKEMKTLLDLAAKTAIQHDKELKAYYQRKLAEGKSKMGIINAIRNKMIGRMFAVVKRQTPFIENYLQAA
jgi:transposase